MDLEVIVTPYTIRNLTEGDLFIEKSCTLEQY